MIHTACFALLLVGGTLSQGRRIQNQEEEVQLFASSSKHQFDADCTYPECYSSSETTVGGCNFDTGGQQAVQAPISACSGWFRAYRWYKLQFQLREHTIGGLPQLNNGGTVRPEENTNLTEYSDIPPRGVDVTTTLFLITLMQIGGNGRIYAESRCYQKANMATLDYPGVTTAIIRSPGIGGSSGCDIYQLSFWYLLSSEPHFSDDDAERSYLEVFRQYSPRGTPANQIPTDLLWGSRSDYDLGFPGPNTWSKATVEFSADALFTLNFFAHHPNNCIDNGTIIALDSITTLRAVAAECTDTTMPITTSTLREDRETSTVRETLVTAQTKDPLTDFVANTSRKMDGSSSETFPAVSTLSIIEATTSSAFDGSRCPACPSAQTLTYSGWSMLEITCIKGRVSISDADPETAEATSASFNGDNSFGCRAILNAFQSYMLTATPSFARTGEIAFISCRKGDIQFTDSDPMSSEATSFLYEGDNSYKCRGFLYNLHKFAVHSLG